MELSYITFLIVCPLVFLAGFVDAIGGGGGLISLPAYILAGLPTHSAIATNKLSSALGTTVTTVKFIREKLLNFKLAIPTIICAIIGSSIGAKLSLRMDEKLLGIVLLPVLFVAAFLVLNKKIFKEDEGNTEITKKVYLVGSIAALVVGCYDGFYGPGTGTFLIIAFHVFAKLDTKLSNAQAKVINLTTNVTSLMVFIMGGQVVWILGAVAALCNMAGNYIGARLVISKGSRITRPIIIEVLTILFVKIVFEMC